MAQHRPTALPQISRLNLPEGAVLPRADGGHDLLLTPDVLALLKDQSLADLSDIAPDLDAWNLRKRGDWFVFTAAIQGPFGARDYRRHEDLGDILADAPGPIWGHIGFGGPRRAGFVAGPPRFNRHIVAPGDHIHSVGLEGTARVEPTGAVQILPHQSLETLLADRLLGARLAAKRALPLHFVRVETDPQPGVDSLGFQNFTSAVTSLCAAAQRLGTSARIGSIGLDVTWAGNLEQTMQRVHDVMAETALHLAQTGLPKAPFVVFADPGGDALQSLVTALAHWHLAWSHFPHRVVLPGPAYAFDHSRFGRPTEEGLCQMADLAAHALTGENWQLPVPLLAEVRKKRVRVLFQSDGPLVLDPALTPGAAMGFSIQSGKRVSIETVEIAADDPKALYLTLDRQIDSAAQLGYAVPPLNGAPDLPYPVPGGVRDGWAAPGDGDKVLHRWALPALIPIHQAEG